MAWRQMSNEPLPEPISQIYVVIWHHQATINEHGSVKYVTHDTTVTKA